MPQRRPGHAHNSTCCAFSYALDLLSPSNRAKVEAALEPASRVTMRRVAEQVNSLNLVPEHFNTDTIRRHRSRECGCCYAPRRETFHLDDQ